MTERAEGTLERLANQILESVEQIANRVEEGFSVLLTGKLPGDQDQSSTRTPGNARMGIDDDEMMEIDEDMLGSPLEGIADSVLKDIMDNQVSFVVLTCAYNLIHNLLIYSSQSSRLDLKRLWNIFMPFAQQLLGPSPSFFP
jgi:hypothetical protein